MRQPQVILVVTLAVLGVLAAALPLGKGDDAAAAGASSWPCCDTCGICNRKMPPECQCLDISVDGCHPECKTCVRNFGAAAAGGGPGPVVTYRCADMLTNFCKNRCTPAPAAAAILLGA